MSNTELIRKGCLPSTWYNVLILEFHFKLTIYQHFYMDWIEIYGIQIVAIDNFILNRSINLCYSTEYFQTCKIVAMPVRIKPIKRTKRTLHNFGGIVNLTDRVKSV